MFQHESTLISQLIELNRVVHKILFEGYQSRFNLAESAIGFLKVLAAPNRVHMTQSDIAQRLSISESTLCTQIEKLRIDGLIVRERLVTDRRKTRLELTPAGKKIVNEVTCVEAEIEARIRQRFAEHVDLETLSVVIQQLLDATQQAQEFKSDVRRAA